VKSLVFKSIVSSLENGIGYISTLLIELMVVEEFVAKVGVI
jgi:hypothetical protein